MVLPQVLGKLVISTIPLSMTLTLGTTWDVTKVLDMVQTMNGTAVASKIRLAPENLIAVAMGAGEGSGPDSGVLWRIGLTWGQ